MSPASPHDAGKAQASRRDARSQGRELALLALCHLDGCPAADRIEALELLWRNPPRGDDERGRGFAAAVADQRGGP
ncbi:MAG: hypothetical protein AB1Z98_10740, partial [Nannocystaceae bacterium]